MNDFILSTVCQMKCIRCGKDCSFGTFGTYEGAQGTICGLCMEEIKTTKPPNVLPMEEGCDTIRKTELLHSRIQAVIDEEQFGDMTIAEIIGTLEIVKATHINWLFQE